LTQGHEGLVGLCLAVIRQEAAKAVKRVQLKLRDWLVMQPKLFTSLHSSALFERLESKLKLADADQPVFEILRDPDLLYADQEMAIGTYDPVSMQFLVSSGVLVPAGVNVFKFSCRLMRQIILANFSGQRVGIPRVPRLQDLPGLKEVIKRSLEVADVRTMSSSLSFKKTGGFHERCVHIEVHSCMRQIVPETFYAVAESLLTRSHRLDSILLDSVTFVVEFKSSLLVLAKHREAMQQAREYADEVNAGFSCVINFVNESAFHSLELAAERLSSDRELLLHVVHSTAFDKHDIIDG
jgi:hypothetical protein